MSFKIDCKRRHTFLKSASTNEKANSVGVQSTNILPEVNLLVPNRSIVYFDQLEYFATIAMNVWYNVLANYDV